MVVFSVCVLVVSNRNVKRKRVRKKKFPNEGRGCAYVRVLMVESPFFACFLFVWIFWRKKREKGRFASLFFYLRFLSCIFTIKP